MAFEDTTGGLGGLGGFVSGLGDKLGSSDMLTALALIDAGRARVNPPPLAQTLGPIMALQAKQQDQNRERAALSNVLQQIYKIPKAQADQLAASDKAAGFAVQGLQFNRQQDTLKNTQSEFDRIMGGGTATPSGPRADASPADPEVENRFVSTLQQGGLTNPNGLAAVAAYGNAESRYSPDNVSRAWSDPSERGQPGTSGGIMSWRDDRLNNMMKFTAGADDPVAAQAQFMLAENPELTNALQNAKSPEEAHGLMANAWKFAGYDRPGGEYQRRLDLTNSYAQRFAGNATPGHLTEPPPMNLGGADSTTQVASNDPSFVPPSYPGGVLPRRVQIANDEQQTQALERGLNMMPGGGDDGKSPSQVLVEQQRARDAGAAGQVAQSANTASDAPQPGVTASLPPAPVMQARGQAQVAQDAQRAQQGQLSRMEALQKAAAFAKLGLAYEGAGVKGGADNLKPFTEFYLGLAKPTDTERDLVQQGLRPGTPEYMERYRDAKSPASLQEARVLNPTDQAAGLREKLQLENTKGEDAYSQKVGGGLGETVSKMYDQYAAAYDPATVNLKQMQVMKDLTQNPNLYIGAGGEAVNELKKRALAVGQFLGMSEDQLKDLRAGASAGEVMQKIARQYAAGTAQSTVGSRVTNFELDTVLKSNPGLASTPQGAQLMLDLMMRNEQRKIDLSNAVVAYAENSDKKPTVSGMRKIAEEYDAKNPLITDEMRARLKGIPNAGEAPAEAPAKADRSNRVVPSFADIPEGATYRAPETGRVYKKVNGKAVPVKE